MTVGGEWLIRGARQLGRDPSDLLLRNGVIAEAGPAGSVSAPAGAQVYDADGQINDARGVKVGFTNASLFSYVADGRNGLRVLQLTSPERTPWYEGFSPRPAPQLIATYHTHGPALAVSKGLDRDRAVDESGHQVSVFGRMGARPFNLEEMQRLYLRNGQIYTVTDTPPGPPTPAR